MEILKSKEEVSGRRCMPDQSPRALDFQQSSAKTSVGILELLDESKELLLTKDIVESYLCIN